MSCAHPFHSLYVLPDGYSTCCQSWLAKEFWLIDPTHTLGPWEAWNHPQFVELRRRVLAGQFRQCATCVRLAGGEVPERLPSPASPVMPHGPRRLVLTDDLVCNLHCWSCRKGPIGRNPKTEAIRERRMLAIADAFKADVRNLVLLQSGEVFASPIHMRLLKSMSQETWPQCQITLTTNGTLMAKRWNEIESCHPLIHGISISVDAATPATYEAVRLGGKWQDVLSGLRLASQLRRDGKIEWLQASFVVQGRNVRDVPLFVDLCESLGVDKCIFTRLTRWWQTEEEWNQRNIASPSHPRHAEYIRVCNDERLRKPFVSATQLIARSKDLVRG